MNTVLDRLTSGVQRRGVAALSHPNPRKPALLTAQTSPDGFLRDLRWLFNGAGPLSEVGDGFKTKYPYASSSVLAYGLRGILGQVVQNPEALGERIKQALMRYEPRMRIRELKVRVSSEGQLLEIDIQGEMVVKKELRKLHVRTDLTTLRSQIGPDANG